MAAVVEDLGFDSIWTSDHIIVPEGSSYIPEVMLEPLATLSHLAARTSHVTLGVSVLVVPYRDPVFTAKYLSSLDVISGGRLVLGVGIGWLEQEFRALGASFEERGAQTDEYLAVMRDLWETETSSYDGKWKQYENMRMFPKAAPERRGTIPIWVGGNTGPAHRRAAKLGDGWHPINMTPSELAAGVVAYRAACADAGRSPGPVCLRHMPGRPGRRAARRCSRAHPTSRPATSARTPRQASTSSCSRCRGAHSTISPRASARSCARSSPACSGRRCRASAGSHRDADPRADERCGRHLRHGVTPLALAVAAHHEQIAAPELERV